MENQQREMVQVIGGLFTTKYTEVWHEKDYKHNAPHHFDVIAPDGEGNATHLCRVDFQEGPIKECGVNGVCNEDLIAMVITRLNAFQQSPYSSRENALAITKLEEALLWLRKRTMDREARGVEGTNKI